MFAFRRIILHRPFRNREFLSRALRRVIWIGLRKTSATMRLSLKPQMFWNLPVVHWLRLVQLVYSNVQCQMLNANASDTVFFCQHLLLTSIFAEKQPFFFLQMVTTVATLLLLAQEILERAASSNNQIASQDQHNFTCNCTFDKLIHSIWPWFCFVL